MHFFNRISNNKRENSGGNSKYLGKKKREHYEKEKKTRIGKLEKFGKIWI